MRQTGKFGGSQATGRWAKMDLAGKIGLQNSGGGNFKKFIHKEFSGIIPYCTI